MNLYYLHECACHRVNSYAFCFNRRFEVALRQTEDSLLIPSQLPKKVPSRITVPAASPGGKTLNHRDLIVCSDPHAAAFVCMHALLSSQTSREFDDVQCILLGQIIRRYELCYIPPGFWPRLIARLILFPVRTLFGGQVRRKLTAAAIPV